MRESGINIAKLAAGLYKLRQTAFLVLSGVAAYLKTCKLSPDP